MRAAWWWIDRWRQSTAYTDMTAEEQGLYRNLCDEVWLREDHVIPDDPRVLSRVSGDPDAWARCSKKVLRWMKHIKGGWTNDTALEVIGQSKRRAENQRRYRQRLDNATNNKPANNPDNKPDSPSPSPSLDKTPSPSRTDLSTNQATQPNPLVNRNALVSEGHELISWLAEREDLDPTEVLGKSSSWKGSRKMRLDVMTDDRLANTLIELRDWKRRLEGRAETGPRPAPSEKASGRRTALESELKASMHDDRRSVGEGVGEAKLLPSGSRSR